MPMFDFPPKLKLSGFEFNLKTSFGVAALYELAGVFVRVLPEYISNVSDGTGICMIKLLSYDEIKRLNSNIGNLEIRQRGRKPKEESDCDT